MNNISLVITFLWLFLLSYFFYRLKHHYNNLLKRTKKQHIDEILDAILQKEEKLEIEVKLLKKELVKAINQSNFYIQKVGMIRFNPFERGGEPSFALGLFDKENSGLILNFIYTKEGLRVYPKIVKKGKGETHPLTQEEEKLIEESKPLFG